MNESIPALVAEARRFDTEPAEYAVRLKGAHDLIARLADALESLSVPSGDDREPLMPDLIPDEEREVMAQIMIEGIPTTDMKSDAYVLADELIAAGFRRVSPVTREALARRMYDAKRATATLRGRITWDEEPEWKRDEFYFYADVALSVSPPAEVEWEYAVKHERDGRIVDIFSEENARSYVRGVDTVTYPDGRVEEFPRTLVRAPKRVWVPVTPGEGKGQ